MMDNYNKAPSLVMHIDLNSAFATIEQQSRPLLRNRPVAVINRRTEHTSIVAASYEAKSLGVGVGMKLKEALRLAPNLVAVESDPAKYRHVYRKLMAILNDYSPNVVMKSIDEGVIDFHGIPNCRPLVDIGYEIKKRLRDEVGCAMRCNVGIGPSRFLAKTAAGLHKPDGLDIIDSSNLRSIYETMKLTDITGIAEQMQKRLNAVGIFTPIQFLDADMISLQKIVFKSIDGCHWYQRLRGYEVDNRKFDIKTIGRQYVLESRNLTMNEIKSRLHYLCESVGSRLRHQNLVAKGVHVHVRTIDKKYWHIGRTYYVPFFSDITINNLAQQLFLNAPDDIQEIGVRVYNLSCNEDQQPSLFFDEMIREQQLVGAIDTINQRYGDRTVHCASTLTNNEFIKSKISFGSTRYL
ncbi:MAG: DNA polymerase Y family protein [Anaerolineaceae bacterium]